MENSNPNPKLAQAVEALQKMRQKLEKVEYARHEPVAIVGMACRFPGAGSPEAFWDLLQRGEDRVREIPPDRWNVDEHYDPIPGTPGKSYLREVALLDKVDEFDPQFFGISPREAERMDPQQRLLLEVAWEALERAGLPPQTIRNSKAGVFVGVSGSEYISLMDDAQRTDTYSSLGNCIIFASGRLSYVLGLQGPSMVIDTACSASLLGVHLACESLRNRSSDLALAGGVHLLLSPQGNIAMSQMQAVAPDGRSKTFDAAANGFGRGEGCGIVVLKRLSDAQAAGDPILAVIRGSATNHDGPSSGLTVPSATAQAALIRAALADGKVAADEVLYVEAHGTGTTLGDPIEVRALESVFAPRREPLLVGSVKTNIGHLEEAAGIAGLMKVVLSMQKGQIPPHLHFRNPNPHISWDNTVIRVAAGGAPWPAGKKVAGVSSFGMGGSNAHVVLEEAPAPAVQPAAGVETNEAERPAHLLTISAKTGAGLQDYAARYADFLAAEPEINLGDVCYSAAVGRNHFAQRLAVVGASAQEMEEHLRAFAAAQPAAGVVSAAAGQNAPPVAFLFTGQGSQFVGMGRELYATQPLFRAALDRCAQLFAAELERPLLDVMFGTGNTGNPETDKALLDDTAYTQPALFALEYALAELWQAWGVQPSAVVGHSIGEYAAACIAGVMSLEDAVRLVAARGRLMSALPQDGEMVSLQADEARVRMALGPYAADVSIAAVNGPASVVIAGRREAVQAVAEQFAAEGVKTQRLVVSHAFHSPLMEPMLPAFREVAGSITYHKPALRLISNVTGKAAGDEITKPEYWVRHVRNTVRFADGVAALHAQNIGIFLEIGPKPVLLGMAGQIPVSREQPLMAPSLRAGQSDRQQMLTSLGNLWTHGVEVDWESFDRPSARRKVVVPTYPFQRQRYWIEAPKRKRAAAVRPLIDKVTRLPLHGETVYEAEFSVEALPFLADHRVYGQVVSPAACQVAMALNAAELSLGKQGTPVLEEVVLPRALVIPPAGVRTVQAVFHRSATSGQPAAGQAVRHEFQIVSFFEGEGAQDAAIVADGGGAAADQPPVHATGYAKAGAGGLPAALDPADLRRRCGEAVDTAGLYATGGQIELGPAFQWVAEAWRGGAESAPEALARLVRPTAIDNLAGYLLHPGLLDACFQTAGLTVQREDETLLPFALAAVRVYQPAQGEVWWCHAVQTAAHKWDIQLLDEQGHVIAAIEGFQVRPAPAAAIHGDALWRQWLYRVQWQAAALTPQEGASADLAGQRWIVFADPQGIGAALAQRLRQHGARVLEVYAGEGRRQVDEDRIEIAPAQAEDYRRLVAAVPALQGVVHLWSLGSATGGAGEIAGEIGGQPLVQAMRHGCESALLLAQALLHEQAALAGLWLVTQDAQAAAAEDGVSGMAQAGLWGVGRVLALEHPELTPRCVDLPPTDDVMGDATGDVTGAALAERLCAEVLAQRAQTAGQAGAERQIVLRRNARYAPRLQRFTPPALADLRCRPDATYLVTGGLGGLGLAVAERLAQAGARQLVLMGRSAPKSEVQARLNAMAAQGVKVTVAQADVSDRQQLQAVIDGIDAACPLAGVVHSAGVLDDGALMQQSWDRFAAVLGPKAQGAWNLHAATAGMALDFFVLFSSAAAVLGSRGQSNYVAANAFLDALAHHRRAVGLPALSIDWGAWAEIGMAAAMMRDGRAQLAGQGADAIAPAQGLAAFAHLVPQEAAQVAVFVMDWGKWQALDPVAAGDPLLSQLLVAAQPAERAKGQVTQATLLAAAGPEQEELLHTYLTQQAARVLRMAVKELNVHEPLPFLGLDSLMALELKNRIASDLQLNIPVVQLLEGSSVSDVQERLLLQLEELGAAVPAHQPAQSPQEGQDPGVNPDASAGAGAGADGQDTLAMLQELDEMSEERIDLLLQRLLAEEGSL